MTGGGPHRLTRALGLTVTALTLATASAPPSASALPRARLVRDIVPGADGSQPDFAGVVNGMLLFFATDAAHGRELWRSDGSAEGTQLVRDIWPGPQSGVGYGGFAGFHGKLAFSASDGQGGAQLWVSDGSEAGTVLVRDAQPGGANATARLLTPADDRLWFTVQSNFFDEDLQGSEDLWTTDLTPGGTSPVAAVGYWEPGFSGGAAAVASLTPFHDGVLVSRKDALECCESTSLRHVDATGTNTLVYQSEVSGHLGYLPAVQPWAAGDTAYFVTRDAYGQSCSLLRTDGVGLVQIDVGAAACELVPLQVFGGDLLLSRYGTHVRLARATPGGTALVPIADLGAGYLGAAVETPTGLYFSVVRSGADDLWRADGAIDPPVLVRRFDGDDDDMRSPHSLRGLVRDGDGVLFWIGDPEGGNNTLWQSRGSRQTTRPIGIEPAAMPAGSVIEDGAILFLRGDDPEHGAELWAIRRGPECAGDCDADGAVDVAEVITAIDIVLGQRGLDACPAADVNADLGVSIDEIVSAVRGVLEGCGESERPS